MKIQMFSEENVDELFDKIEDNEPTAIIGFWVITSFDIWSCETAKIMSAVMGYEGFKKHFEIVLNAGSSYLKMNVPLSKTVHHYLSFKDISHQSLEMKLKMAFAKIREDKTRRVHVCFLSDPEFADDAPTNFVVSGFRKFVDENKTLLEEFVDEINIIHNNKGNCLPMLQELVDISNEKTRQKEEPLDVKKVEKAKKLFEEVDDWK